MPTRRSALVYTPAPTLHVVRDVDDYLLKERLYRYDDVQEAAADALLPVVERPVLRRVVWLATVPDAPTVLVTDHLSSLGDDDVSQTAVVGALMQCGVAIQVRDGVGVDGGWYQSRVRALGFQQVSSVMDILLDTGTITGAMLSRWQEHLRGESRVLPTSVSRGHDEAALRIKDLSELEGLSNTEIARRLTVGGYRNRHGRVVWYPEAVRKVQEGRR